MHLDDEGLAYLDDEGLVLEAGTHAQLAHVGGFVDEVLDAVENSSAGGGDAAVDSPLADGFPGDAGVSVDVLQNTTDTTDEETPGDEKITTGFILVCPGCTLT